MTRRIVLTLVIGAVATAFAGASLLAHPGHEHKILGTVTMAAPDHVMLTDKDGKDHTVRINAETKFTRAKKAMTAADMKAGMRVVVTAVTGKDEETPIAKVIELGPPPAAK